MHTAVIVLVICSKKRFKLNDMHIIIMLAQGPEAIRNTVYGADNIFILVKRSIFCGTALDLFPELLRKLSAGSRIVIGIDCSLFLAGKIKSHFSDFNISIA